MSAANRIPGKGRLTPALTARFTIDGRTLTAYTTFAGGGGFGGGCGLCRLVCAGLRRADCRRSGGGVGRGQKLADF